MSRVLRPLLLASLAALAAARGAEPGAAKPQKVLRGWEALTSRAEARGLYDEAALEWIKAALANPKSPGAELALRRLATLRDRFAASRPLVKPLTELSRKEEASPIVRFLAGKLLVGYLREAGDWREARRVAASLGYIKTWLVTGTFGRNIAATHDRVFGPEKNLSMAAAYDSGRYCALSKLKWRKLPAPVSGEPLTPYAYLNPQSGATYLLAQVKAKGGSFGTYLLVETRAAFKVWVNGRPVFDGDRHRKSLPREVVIDTVLDRDGWNRILIKLSSPASLSVRLAREGTGEPVKLPVESKAVIHPPGRRAAAPPKGRPPYPRLLWEAPKKPAEMAALGVLSSLQSLDDDAVHYLKRAVAEDPGRAAWQYLLGEAYRDAAHLSAPARRNLSAEAYRAGLELDSGFAPARLRLAELDLDEGREESALDGLKKALAASPGCYLARLRMADIAARLAWRNQARAWLSDAQKLRPDYAGCRLLEARLQMKNGQLDRAIAECRELVKADAAHDGYRKLLVRGLGDRGLWRDAVKVCRATVKIRPRDPAAHVALVNCLESAGRFREAAEATAALIALEPAEAAYRRELGELLAKAADRKASLDAYRKALELDPSDHRLRRLVERLSGVNDDFSAPYALDIAKEIAESKKRRYLQASVVRVLDQTVVRVYRDGSLAETIADGERILAEKGIEKLSTQPILGEFMEARTHRKNGEILEPTVIPGERRLTMPGLEIGATVEYKYRLDEEPRSWGGFYLSKWYFRSHGLDEPHQVSDYIVMVPKGLAHKVVRHNFDVPERVEEKDGLVIYRWTARNRRRVAAEPHMPHFDSYLPFVEIGTERSWQEVAEGFRSIYLGRTRPTRRVRAAAARAVAGRKTTEQKARGIYEFVNEHVKHRGAYRNAHQALVAGAGDREMVFIALAEAAGLEVCQGRTRRSPRFQGKDDSPATWSLPSERNFTAELVGVRLPGARVLWLDLSSRFMPFGTLRRELGGARVLAVPPRGRAFFERLPQPDFDRAGETAELELTLSAGGKLTGLMTLRNLGSDAARAKERLARLDAAGRRNMVQARLAGLFRGASLLEVTFTGAGEAEAPLVTRARFEVDGHLTPAAGGRLICRPGIDPLNLVSELAMDPTRQYPLKLASARIVREVLRYRLPAGLEVAALPKGAVLSGKFGTYSLTAEKTPGGFKVERRALLLPQTISAKDYPAFRAFCRRVDEAERARAVLRRKK